MKTTALSLLLSFGGLALVHGVPCTPASNPDPSNWVFDASPTEHPSCSSSGGGVNDLGSAPVQCEGDLASVYTRLDPATYGAECLSAKASLCKIPMYNFTSLDYDFSIDSCNGVWAAPLWMTPDTWQWDGGSGEIDSLELCPRSSISMNFAGGGSQVELDASTFSIDFTDNAHVTVRKDEEGIVTITTCQQEELQNSQCPPPTYSSCDDCLYNNNGEFACWCNNAGNIYSSGGCTDGTDCLWTLVSDVWNGVSGDAGYTGCMTEVPEIGLAAGKPNMDSKCTVSVERITLRGDNGAPLTFAPGSPSSCSTLTANSN
ncbi:hypothetical protein TrVE_jg7025 [Triparma verrucosa]|uniref:Cyanovirin-N domain-containing protein n=1 Tax=Triparma verrucosa TaxID=1606542 RepID=A0A9W7CGF3_9STRA|nr:hypothetical protein TrVE_jg7025 [Triparma verrucosa]